MTAVPILTYHAARISGNEYNTNDHVAFSEDLRVISALNYRIVSLGQIADRILSGDELPDRAVAITFDDGTDFDFKDLLHPTHGQQRSIINIVRDFIEIFGPKRQPDINVTSFVIASPAARNDLDARCLAGQDWMTHHWWKDAARTQIMSIGNHSWDHNHPEVSEPLTQAGLGTFSSIDSFDLAHKEIKSAFDYIIGESQDVNSSLFAYPYGETNDFLVKEYFPQGEAITGVRAAFTTEPMHATSSSNRWMIPRYVCGSHWHSPEELTRILNLGK